MVDVDHAVSAAAVHLVRTLAATPDESDTLVRQVLGGEVAVIVSADGVSVVPVQNAVTMITPEGVAVATAKGKGDG